MTSDHFGELLQSFVCNNPLVNFQYHRTKCAALIENVIAEAISEDLRDELKNSAYALLIDEWSDISVKPHLAVMVIFYSKTKDSLVTSLLSLKSLAKIDSEHIFMAMSDVCRVFNLDLHNCVGFGSDGANVIFW